MPVILSQLPNIISLGRLLLTPVVVWLILAQQITLALYLFALASVSDAADGLLARWLKCPSTLGHYLDPVADKALIMAVYITLGLHAMLPAWLVILVISRDLIIIGSVLLMAVLSIRNFTTKPFMVSKINTAGQLILVVWVLAGSAYTLIQPWLTTALIVTVAATSTVSGLLYMIYGLKHLSTSD